MRRWCGEGAHSDLGSAAGWPNGRRREGPNGRECTLAVSLGRARCPKTRPLALPLEAKGKAPQDQRSGEARTATSGHGGSGTDRLMKWVVEHDNVTGTGKRVWQNKGSSGVGGGAVEELPAYLAAHGEAIRAQ